MRIEKEGDDLVTTPIYVGDNDQVAKMTRCSHRRYQEISSTDLSPTEIQAFVEMGFKKGRFVRAVIERCACGAQRSRYSAATPSDLRKEGPSVKA